MIDKPLNILMLEDLRTDAELVKRQVLKTAPQSVFTIARNRAEFFDKLKWSLPDLVLADYNLPDINGLEALLHIREVMPNTPFIFISGTLNDEEKVAEAVLKGASGYVLKENLHLLPDRLLLVLQKAEADLAAEKEEERRWREAGLSLQKALSLLEKAQDFEGKDQVRLLLNNVLDTLQT
jgi:CheY-like chemotaxis protein